MIIKRLVRYLRRTAVRTLARLAMVTRRPQNIALIYGAPDDEENSLVTALRLSVRYAGEVILVCQSPAQTKNYLATVAQNIGGDINAITCVPMKKWHVLWSYYGPASLVFYTHGLFFSPRPIGKRIHINLWHGTGPKLASNRNFPSVFDADALSSASEIWGKSTAQSLRMSNPRVIAGNARSDLLVAKSDARSRLGWNEPVVLWLPTYRRSREVSVGTLSEGHSLMIQDAQKLIDAARASNIRFLAKPHPFDAAALSELGVDVITTNEIWRLGLTPSQMIAAADGVISDYSSAWVDALIAKVTVGLYCPDLDDYIRDRGFNEPPMNVVARDLILDDDSIGDYFAAITQKVAFRPDAQDYVRTALKLPEEPRADHMLDQVRELAASVKNMNVDFKE